MTSQIENLNLIVAKSSSSPEALSNCLYIHSDQTAAKSGLMRFEGSPFLFPFRCDSQQSSDTVRVSGPVRRLLSLALKEAVKVSIVTSQCSPLPEADKVVLSVNPLKKMDLKQLKSSSTQPQNWDWKGFFRDLPLSKGLSYLRQVNDITFTVKVLQVSSSRGPLEYGQSSEATTFQLAKEIHRDLGNSRALSSSSAPQYLNDWDFEEEPEQGLVVDFKSFGIGGLKEKLEEITERLMLYRLLAKEQQEKYGIKPTKGLLLYGPPGTGKTLTARVLGKMCGIPDSRVTVMNAPEAKSKWVGEGEKAVKGLFDKALKDPSHLHLILIDEADAIFGKRGSSPNQNHGDGLVNQMLTCMDGIRELDNVIVVALTNRRDIIDEAMLRPGRLEIQMEITLPDLAGRLEILEIQTETLRENKMLTDSVDLCAIASKTENYTGAELAGLVRAAVAHANKGNFEQNAEGKLVPKSGAVDLNKVTGSHFQKALGQIQPAYGRSASKLAGMTSSKPVLYSAELKETIDSVKQCIQAFMRSPKNGLRSFLLEGPSGVGKTFLAAHIANSVDAPFVSVLSAHDLAGYSDTQRVQRLSELFRDASRSDLAVVFLDDLSGILGYSPPYKYMESTYGLLKSTLTKASDMGKKLVLIASNSDAEFLDRLALRNIFSKKQSIPAVSTIEGIKKVLFEDWGYGELDQSQQSDPTTLPRPITIRELNFIIEQIDLSSYEGKPDKLLSKIVSETGQEDCSP